MRQISCGSQLNKMAFYTGIVSVASFTVAASFPVSKYKVFFFVLHIIPVRTVESINQKLSCRFWQLKADIRERDIKKK